MGCRTVHDLKDPAAATAGACQEVYAVTYQRQALALVEMVGEASPTEFEWQSQNRATQTNTYGERVKNHRARGEAVHLFVRRHRKLNGGSAPFVYCGEVDFKSWTGSVRSPCGGR